MKTFFSTFFLLMVIPAYAALEGVLPSTDWQKAALEKDITTRLEKRLDTVVRNKQYIIDVNITTSIPQKPDFKLSPPKPPLNIKYANVSPDKSSGDYIVFRKLGIEVPIIAAQEDTSDKSKKSELEFIWKYNESIDVYKNLEKIKINISLSEKLPEKSRTQIKTLIQTMDAGTGDIKPSYDFKFIDFALDAPEEKKPEVTEVKEPTIWEKAAQFSNAIGLLLATLLFGIIAFLLMKKYENIHKEDSKASAMPSPAHGNQDQKDKDPSQAIAGAQSEEESETSGFERFTLYFEKNPDAACMMIRKWIKSSTPSEKMALHGLVRALDNKLLLSVFEKISLEDREKWKTIIHEKEHHPKDLKDVNHFIAQQVVEEIIVPNAVDDKELLEIMMEIDNDNAAKFIQKHPDLAPYFIQLLSSRNLSLVFKYLNPATIKTLLKSAAKLTADEIKNKTYELKKGLAPYAGKSENNAFVKKLIELVPLTPSGKEQPLFESLREAEAFVAVRKLSKEFYPSFLIKEFSSAQLGSFLAGYPTNKKTELIFSLPEDEKHTYLEALGPDGSAVKQMVIMELENLESNPAMSKEITDKAEDIWSDFVTHARLIIRENFEATPDYRAALEEWLEMSSKPELTIVQSA